MDLSGPASAENQTVILWVVCVMVPLLGIVVGALWRTMNANQKECREESVKNRTVAETAQAQVTQNLKDHGEKVEKLLCGALTETQRLAQTAIDECRQNREVLASNTKVLAGIESGHYRTRTT